MHGACETETDAPSVSGRHWSWGSSSLLGLFFEAGVFATLESDPSTRPEKGKGPWVKKKKRSSSALRKLSSAQHVSFSRARSSFRLAPPSSPFGDRHCPRAAPTATTDSRRRVSPWVALRTAGFVFGSRMVSVVQNCPPSCTDRYDRGRRVSLWVDVHAWGVWTLELQGNGGA